MVDERELQRGVEVRQDAPGLVFRDRRNSPVAEETSHGFLPETDFLPGEPEAIEMVVWRLTHTAVSE